jgi:hypothetical protein
LDHIAPTEKEEEWEESTGRDEKMHKLAAENGPVASYLVIGILIA